MLIKPVPGICDRCGQRFALKDLKEEDIMGRRTGLLVCHSCYSPSHPQLDTRTVKTNDKQSVKNARSDKMELAEGRALMGFNPVGQDATSTITLSMGVVRAEVE